VFPVVLAYPDTFAPVDNGDTNCIRVPFPQLLIQTFSLTERVNYRHSHSYNYEQMEPIRLDNPGRAHFGYAQCKQDHAPTQLTCRGAGTVPALVYANH
jgi:hypothetical protein